MLLGKFLGSSSLAYLIFSAFLCEFLNIQRRSKLKVIRKGSYIEDFRDFEKKVSHGNEEDTLLFFLIFMQMINLIGYAIIYRKGSRFLIVRILIYILFFILLMS